MIKEIKDFKRKELFEHYNSFDNPFVFVTTKIDVTNLVNFCKKNKYFYGTMGYLVAKSINEIDNFKYRYENNKFYYCDFVRPSYTQMYKDGNIGYFHVPTYDSYEDFIKKFAKSQEDFYNKNTYDDKDFLDEVWVSCSPWISFTGLVTPFKKEITIPQIIWDKYELVGDKYYMNIMIMVHHGFADGSHIGKFIELLNQNINDIN